MGQSQGTGSGSSVLPNWGGDQAGAGAATSAPGAVPWYAQQSYGSTTPGVAQPTSTAGTLYQPVTGDRREAPARETYVAPPPAAKAVAAKGPTMPDTSKWPGGVPIAGYASPQAAWQQYFAVRDMTTPSAFVQKINAELGYAPGAKAKAK